MSAAPFDVRVIATRLREQVPTLKTVGMRADYAAIRGLADFPAPSAYVILASELGSHSASGYVTPGSSQRAAQFVPVQFGVVLAVRNYREQRGEQLADELTTMLDATRRAVLGFVPPVPGGRPCEFVRGDLMDYDAGVALWADVFATQHLISNT